ncbi:S49 family peptidase [bacterium]|nr:S49 family peptidase [bacterium]
MRASRIVQIVRIARIVLGLLVLAAAPALAARGGNPFLDYRGGSWLVPQTPAVTGGPVAGLFNPAAAVLNDVGGADFWWNDTDIRSGLDDYGFALGRNLSFAMNATTFGTHAESWKIYDYQLGLAGGSRDHAFGLAYRWSNGETARTPREDALVVGTVSRPFRWLSFGAAGTFALGPAAYQGVFDVGLRPLGTDLLTLHADWTANDDERFLADGSWGAGVELRPVDGVHLGFKAREAADGGDPDYGAFLGVTLGFSTFGALPVYSGASDERLRTTYLVRSNPPLRGLPLGGLTLGKRTTYFPLSLENRVLTYQKYRWFDDERIAWLDLLPLLDAVRDADDIDIVAVNLAGFRGRPSLVWELREKLLEIRRTGKELVIHVDNPGALVYWLAAIGDQVTIDPYGMVTIPGLALSRSYLKGTLEKLGLGFQEHRYFKYKSAAETLSRDHMSDADREQRQRIVDVIYTTFRDGAAAARDLGPDQFDALVDEQALLTAAEAQAAGLVDGAARWDGVLKRLRDERGARPVRKAPRDYPREFWDEQWGQPAKIPVVYAVGPCAMDSGINGRKTSAYLRGLIGDPDVKAVVLRADSPGGEVLPSDLVAEAIAQLRAAGKPVVVSQGDVAASGGYWISMNGAEILTTPLTITGSVGVISGWLWDDGFAEKAGVTSDVVHRGAHADLYANVNLPFLGGIPRRPMTDAELARVEHVIRGMYGQFVDAVARGRGMTPEAVDAIAQGRVWMGPDAVANGLADRLGTLDQAIGRARELAGIPAGREIELVEYPPRPLVQWPSFGPRLPGLFGLGTWVNGGLAHLYGRDAEAAEPVPALLGAPGLGTAQVDYLQSLNAARGGAAVLVDPDLLPEAWTGHD